MKRSVFLAVFTLASLFATALYAAKTLPEKTTLQQYVAFVQKAAGTPENAKADPDRSLGPGYTSQADGISLALSEKLNAGNSVDQTMAAMLNTDKVICDDFKPATGARQSLDGLVLLRASFDCRLTTDNFYGEYLVIADGSRHQIYTAYGWSSDRPKIAQIATNMFNALAAAYR
jgi:hypothetical protein